MHSRHLFFSRFILFLLGLLLLSGCASNPETTPTLVEFPNTPTIGTPTPIPTLEPTFTLTAESTPMDISTPVTSACSPLEGIRLSELHSITSNPFIAGNTYTDTGHPAIDLAFFIHGKFTTMMGLPVQSVLPGVVVTVVSDRFPYGNMILIETPIELVSESLINTLDLPDPIPAENISLFSSCKGDQTRFSWSEDKRSIYTLYSHLQRPPTFKPGDPVTCGQVIGAVGISGNSIAEHLHLEMRVGPSGAKFGSIANYKEDSTTEERYNYCIWLISGEFQPFDPALLWKTQP